MYHTLDLMVIVGPGLDELVQFVPRTGGGSHITVTFQDVVTGDVSMTHCTCDQLLYCIQCRRVGSSGHEVTNDTETYWYE